MRIGVDARHLTGGPHSGVGQYTLALLRAMTLHPEHVFTILTSGSRACRTRAQEALGDLLGRRNVTHVHRSFPNRLLNLFILLTGQPTFERLFGSPVDVIWCPNLNFFPKHRTPIVVTFHDLSFTMMPHLYSLRQRLWHTLVRPRTIAHRATVIIAPSKTTAMDLERLYGASNPIHRGREKPEAPKDSLRSGTNSESLRFGISSPIAATDPKLPHTCIHVIPHGVDETFSPRPEPQDHGVRSRHDLPRHYLLHIGHEPRKNVVRLVRAFEAAKKQSETMRRLDMKLVLAGGADPDYWLPVTDYSQVLRLGYIRDTDRPALYRGATAFVFPSLYEGFGMPILEAFASGTPVVTSHNSAMLEVGGSAAIFIDPENENDLVHAIQEIVERKDLRDHLTREGLNRIEHFSWQKTAEKTIETLEHALNLKK